MDECRRRNLLFTFADPLKRASAGGTLILDELTGFLKRGIIKSDYDISNVHKVLCARADEASPQRPILSPKDYL